MNYWSIIFGEGSSTRSGVQNEAPLYYIIDSTLKEYFENDLVLCILEPLEIHKLNDAQYRVFVRARLSTEQAQKIGSRFVDMIHELFTEDVSISQSKYLYFGDETGEHEIFDAEDRPTIFPPSADLSDWVEAHTAPLRWHYTTLDASPKGAIDGKFQRYRDAQTNLIAEFFPDSGGGKTEGYLYNLLVPAAFQGADTHSRSKRALGAIFLVVLTKRPIPPALRELLFLRLSLFMYYYHSAEAIDKLIVESGLDRYQRILNMLEMPLTNLTTALSEVERDAQELRAILFEPSRGLLAARHRISDLFKEGEWIQTPDGGSIRVEHQPDQIPDSRHAQWTLAYLLASIRGDKPKIKSAKEALAYELVFFRDARRANESPYQGLAKSLNRFLPGEFDEWCGNGWQKIEDIESLKEVLGTFKQHLFHILKPDYGKGLTLNNIHTLLGIGLRPSSPKAGSVCVVPRLNEPFSSFAHLLEFLGMLVEQHPDFRQHGGEAFEVSVAGCSCLNNSKKSNCFPIVTIAAPSSNWIDAGGKTSAYKDYQAVADDFNRMIDDKSALQSRELRQLGNFRGSFAYLFNRTDPKPKLSTNNECLICGWERFQIRFQGKDLILATVQN